MGGKSRLLWSSELPRTEDAQHGSGMADIQGAALGIESRSRQPQKLESQHEAKITRQQNHRIEDTKPMTTEERRWMDAENERLLIERNKELHQEFKEKQEQMRIMRETLWADHVAVINQQRLDQERLQCKKALREVREEADAATEHKQWTFDDDQYMPRAQRRVQAAAASQQRRWAEDEAELLKQSQHAQEDARGEEQRRLGGESLATQAQNVEETVRRVQQHYEQAPFAREQSALAWQRTNPGNTETLVMVAQYRQINEQKPEEKLTKMLEKTTEQSQPLSVGAEPPSIAMLGHQVRRYGDLVLPRIIHLNFQRITKVRDIWTPISDFVKGLDHHNPNERFTQQEYEEIWEYCIRGCTTSGQFLVKWGFVHDLNEAQYEIDWAVHSIKGSKALRKAIRKRTKLEQETIAQLQQSMSFNPPTAPRSMRASTQQGARPNASPWNKEGAIVGESAPELGANNKGRALMEKMGWKAGMRLGAENTGILAPVSAVVKHGTTGIGMVVDPKNTGGNNGRGRGTQWK